MPDPHFTEVFRTVSSPWIYRFSSCLFSKKHYRNYAISPSPLFMRFSPFFSFPSSPLHLSPCSPFPLFTSSPFPFSLFYTTLPLSPFPLFSLFTFPLFTSILFPCSPFPLSLLTIFPVYHTLSIWLEMEFTSNMFLKMSVRANYLQNLFNNK